MTHTHRYESKLAWQGSTAAGYEAYDRTHRVVVPPAHNEDRAGKVRHELDPQRKAAAAPAASPSPQT